MGTRGSGSCSGCHVPTLRTAPTPPRGQKLPPPGSTPQVQWFAVASSTPADAYNRDLHRPTVTTHAPPRLQAPPYSPLCEQYFFIVRIFAQAVGGSSVSCYRCGPGGALYTRARAHSHSQTVATGDYTTPFLLCYCYFTVIAIVVIV